MTVQTAPAAEATALPAVHRGGRATALGLAGTAVVLLTMAALPYVVESGVTAQLVKLCYLVALASMWNLLAGYAGMMSMGQQAFIGLGAYMLFVVNDETHFVLSPVTSARMNGDHTSSWFPRELLSL